MNKIEFEKEIADWLVRVVIILERTTVKPIHESLEINRIFRLLEAEIYNATGIVYTFTVPDKEPTMDDLLKERPEFVGFLEDAVEKYR